MKSTNYPILLVIIFAVCLTNAFAFNIRKCAGETLKWKSHNIRMRASQVGFPAGDVYTDALTTVINRWNQNPSDFNFNLTFDDADVALNNDQNEIWFSDNSAVLMGAPAITISKIHCIDCWIFGEDVEIVEADVIFDVNQLWTTRIGKHHIWSYGGTNRPFQTTAMHEFGHALGLDDAANTYNIMGQDWTHIHANGNVTYAYPGEDASSGAVYLYGWSSSAAQDVAVVHWKWTGSTSDGYSIHDRTSIYDSDGNTLPALPRAEPVYLVGGGQDIKVEFTYENNGSNSQVVQVGFYISDDDRITTTDTKIGKTTVSLTTNTVHTTTHLVTIPSDLVEHNYYYIGAIVDENNAIVEFYEDNNATYTGIKIADATPKALTFDPRYVDSGDPSTGTLTLNAITGTAGATVLLSSDHDLVKVPDYVEVPAGAASTTFEITTTKTCCDTWFGACITASRFSHDVTSSLYVKAMESTHSDLMFCEAHHDDPIVQLLCAILEMKKEMWHEPYPYRRSLSRNVKVGQTPMYILNLYRELHPILTDVSRRGAVADLLNRIGVLFENAPMGSFYDEHLKASILEKIDSSRTINPQLLKVLAKGVNALELDLSTPSLISMDVRATEYSHVDIQGVTWMAIRNLEKGGKIQLTISDDLPFYPKTYKPGWPIARYDIDFNGKLGDDGSIDISFCIQGIDFVGKLSGLRLLQWDGQSYKDITTNVDLGRGVVAGRTKTLTTFVIMSPRYVSKGDE